MSLRQLFPNKEVETIDINILYDGIFDWNEEFGNDYKKVTVLKFSVKSRQDDDQHGVTELRNLPHTLTELYCSYQKLTKIPENIQNIRILHLDGNRIESIKGIEEITNLMSLSLAKNKLQGELSNFPLTLEYLDLNFNPHIRSIDYSNSDIKNFIPSTNPDITIVGFNGIVMNDPTLREKRKKYIGKLEQFHKQKIENDAYVTKVDKTHQRVLHGPNFKFYTGNHVPVKQYVNQLLEKQQLHQKLRSRYLLDIICKYIPKDDDKIKNIGDHFTSTLDTYKQEKPEIDALFYKQNCYNCRERETTELKQRLIEISKNIDVYNSQEMREYIQDYIEKYKPIEQSINHFPISNKLGMESENLETDMLKRPLNIELHYPKTLIEPKIEEEIIPPQREAKKRKKQKK